MKATGIVRRVDDLGRVVIPKEIRRIQRIRPDDPLEIFPEDDGSVVFRKYSPSDLAFHAGRIAKAFHRLSGYPVLSCNRDKAIGITGGNVKHMAAADRRVSQALYEKLELIRRSGLTYGDFDLLEPVEGAPEVQSFISAPFITTAGDVFGSFSLLCADAAPPDMPMAHFHQFLMAVACVSDLYDEI